MRVVSVLIVFILFLFAACRPESPETVARKWQAHLDNNEFEAAMTLSTPATQELLSWMDAAFESFDPDSTVIHTDLSKMTCRENGDRAVCYYPVQEEGQTYNDSIILVRVNGKWLVDLPEEPLYEEEAENLFEIMSLDSLDAVDSLDQ